MKQTQNNFDFDLFYNTPIIGILRGISTDVLPHILESFYRAGLTTVEITMNSQEVEEQINWTVEHYGDKLNIGAGTVRNPDELDRALGVGASYVVTPNVDEDVITRCKERRIPIFSGALTPTEVYRAYSLGADMVKVFPASVMGADYFKSLKGPLESIPLVATGGIDENNMLEYWKAGASGFGIGSTLFEKNMIAKGDWDGLQAHMKKYVDLVQSRPDRR